MKIRSYRQKFDLIESLEPRPRGFAFEKLLNEIFDDAGVLINYSYKTADQSQQIDGAVELNGRVFLLEAKWEKTDTLAASKLYSFLGKVNSKLEGTLGIFISYNKLNDNFVNAIRDGLRQNCILIHGEENINDIIDGKLELDKFVWYCYRQASTKNRIDVSSSEYASVPQHVTIQIPKASLPRESNWNKIYQELTNQVEAINFTANLQEYYELNQKIPQKTLNVIPSLGFVPLETKKLKILIQKILEEEKNIFVSALIEKFKGDYWRKYAKEHVIAVLPKLGNVSTIDCDKIIRNVTSGFDGDWEIENDSSRVLNLLFPSLTLKEKTLIASLFLEIYVDKSRLPKFEQKKFANKIFEDLKDNGIDLFEFFKSKILEDLSNMKQLESIWLREGSVTQESLKSSIVNRLNEKYFTLIGKQKKDDANAFFIKEYEKL